MKRSLLQAEKASLMTKSQSRLEIKSWKYQLLGYEKEINKPQKYLFSIFLWLLSISLTKHRPFVFDRTVSKRKKQSFFSLC